MLRSPSSSHHTLLLRIEPLVFVNIIILRRDLARWSMVFLLWGLSVFRSGLNFSTFLCRNSSSIFRFSVKGRLMCIVLYTNIVQITMCFLSRSPVTPNHYVSSCMKLLDTKTDFKSHFRCFFVFFFTQTIWGSLFATIWRKIHHYQLNVPQNYYLLNNLVLIGAWT